MYKPLAILLAAISLPAETHTVPPFLITPPIQAALNQISPASLRGNLSFLASDLLAGRDTPSPGLEIAAEYIAAQFRKAGIEPAGDNGYFQTAKLLLQEPNPEGFSFTLTRGDNTVRVPAESAMFRVSQALDLDKVGVFKLDVTDGAFVGGLTAAEMNGKVVIMEFTRGAMQRGRAANAKLRSAKPALVVQLERKAAAGSGRSAAQLFDPEEPQPGSPRITISGEAAGQFYDALKTGASDAVASVHVSAPLQKPVVLHNVVGILRGSDPALKDTAVMVSAHYDHIGQKTSGEGDRIYNGANDDGSGTVSVIELANALATLKTPPKRSIVFVTFFGEEKGGFGSRYYARHPVVPLSKTVGDVNLEQVGRTDSTEGEQRNNATLTGYDYSNMADLMKAAGKLTGIKVYKNEQNSDIYFSASDNVFLADKGVPAHSLSVAFNYPDYHGLGDEWPKVDYGNMARVDRMVAVLLLMIADSPVAPHWNADNPKAAKYFEAWQQAHAK